jgi:adenylyl-sulfate kinase
MTPHAPEAARFIPHGAALSREERWRLRGQRGMTIWLTGLSGTGKSTIASALEARLLRAGLDAVWLDGDNLRTTLCAGLGLSEADRRENVRRVGEVARVIAQSGAIAITSVISPYRDARDRIRASHEGDAIAFVEVHVDAPLDVLRARDPKGLYAQASRGQLRGLTGVDAPYEPPLAPELALRTHECDVHDAVERLFAMIERGACLAPPTLAPSKDQPTPGGKP